MLLRHFFHWLAGQPGFKSRITYADTEYFNPSGVDTAIAKARRERPVPSLDQINHILQSMPARTDIEKRDRAVVALTILAGVRDGALASLKLKHLDVVEGLVRQDAREVKTKFHKTFTTVFFPVGPLARQIVEDWAGHLGANLWGPDDPLFPATRVGLDGEWHFYADGLSREHWSSATPIRQIFKRACRDAGLPYFNPHSFRNTLANLGQKVCRTPEEFKAWSQNLGHEGVMTTFSSYGSVSLGRQTEIIKRLAEPREAAAEVQEAALRLIQLVKGQ